MNIPLRCFRVRLGGDPFGGAGLRSPRERMPGESCRRHQFAFGRAKEGQVAPEYQLERTRN